ncbi:hypothetical protein KOAAANKH_02977 [Brevundimonas sp. NIBR10]|uniref:helix-turn-helix domain-containing protein n=1 Tax=Brevundimonas sp. NIBR10 TaxID=3015997 RepID=UPI0022F16642|nr:helix-turn-helix domain-containing protein [Brevundimonas sp. NIBR10]WGM48088.1 hypothetical protein KOAAANKH_02977 [Brevundimonas sp. NIBR10]
MPKRIEKSNAEIQAALQGCGGIIGIAARQLGMSPRTLSRRIEQTPSLAETLYHVKEGMIDYALGVVIKKGMEGHLPSMKWILRRFAPDRGYGVRTSRTRVLELEKEQLLREQARHIFEAFRPWFEDTPVDER